MYYRALRCRACSAFLRRTLISGHDMRLLISAFSQTKNTSKANLKKLLGVMTFVDIHAKLYTRCILYNLFCCVEKIFFPRREIYSKLTRQRRETYSAKIPQNSHEGRDSKKYLSNVISYRFCPLSRKAGQSIGSEIKKAVQVIRPPVKSKKYCRN